MEIYKCTYCEHEQAQAEPSFYSVSCELCGHRCEPEVHPDTIALRALTETVEAITNLLPGINLMDPPDGGSVSLPEQVKRLLAEKDVEIAILKEQIALIHKSYDPFFTKF